MSFEWQELVGYLASALVVTSLAMTSVVRLRMISLAGSITFTVYGALIGSVPIIITNSSIACLNVWFLSRELGVDRRTLTRWRRWWLETFPTTHAFAEIRAAIVPPPGVATMPLSLIASYEGADPPARLAALLRHLAMIEEAT